LLSWGSRFRCQVLISRRPASGKRPHEDSWPVRLHLSRAR
jgi:hypothetical protein